MSPAETARESLHTALVQGYLSASDVAKAAEEFISDYEITVSEYSAFDERKRLVEDALILRYITLVSVMQDRAYRSIAVVEQEDAGPSRRDLTQLMHKLGVLSDPERFSECAVARNLSAHIYFDEAEFRTQRLNEVLRNSAFVVGAFNDARAYVLKRGLLPVESLMDIHDVALDLPEISPNNRP